MDKQQKQRSTTIATKLKVAIQGYAGAFHDVAARLYFSGQEIDIVPMDTFDELVASVENEQQTQAALMAIENSLAGSLMYNYDLLNRSKLSISGEIFLRIEQNLMALPGVKIMDLAEVHSHPMAIAQSRHFFRQYPHIRLVETTDTALSAKKIAENKLRTTGAIAGALAADLYGLDILASSIETNKQNYTRFLILQPEKDLSPDRKVEKISLCFSLPHEVGSLHHVLAVLSAYNVNLTKIQSAPIIGSPWEYRFFVDFVINGRVGHEQAISAIQPLTKQLNVLGIYEKGKHF